MVTPLGEKARPLEKNKASGASEGLGPLSTGATTGSTAAALGSNETSRGPPMQLFQAPLGQLC